MSSQPASEPVTTAEAIVTAPTQAQRSQRTRQAILAAARSQFATLGFRGTTIRSVATAVGIDPSMVMRYYGSKRELFASATAIDLQLPDLTAVPRAKMGAVAARHFLALWEDESARGTLHILLVNAVTDEAARDQAIALMRAQLRHVVDAVADDPTTVADRTALVAAAVIGTAMCRFLIRFPEAVDLPADVLVDSLGRTIQSALTDDLRPAAGGASPATEAVVDL